jgi:hypothetical protein
MYTLRFHCPGGSIAETFHRDLDGVLRTLSVRDAKLDEHGLACRNPAGQRIAVALWWGDVELSPLTVARMWFGEFGAVRDELAA